MILECKRSPPGIEPVPYFVVVYDFKALNRATTGPGIYATIARKKGYKLLLFHVLKLQEVGGGIPRWRQLRDCFH